MNKLYFISSNLNKIHETKTVLNPLLKDFGYEVEGYDPEGIKEIQSKDMEEIVRDKAMKAYKKLQRPLIVEHTGLLIEDFGGLPGGLTQIFWSSLSSPTPPADKTDANMITCSNFCKHFGGRNTKAVSWVAFCDGKQVKTYKGEIDGRIITAPHERSPFQWDPVFQPNDCDQTFAGMGETAKNQISMRKRALEKFAEDFKKMYQNEPVAQPAEINQYIKEIKELIKQDKLMLFIGSGVSKGLKLPDWNELIGALAKTLGYAPEVFALYGDNLTLAEYYKIAREKKTTPPSLNDWMKTNLALNEDQIRSSPIHQEIVRLGCSIVYTTNYEHALEIAFKSEGSPLHKIADIDGLAAMPANAVQIVKFHGDMDDEKSIVLAERDYFERLNFETPLDIKLRADMLGKSILFLGYSLSDINIRLLSYKLDKLWKDSHDANKRPKSYIFMTQPNPIQEEIFRARGITPIVGEGTDRTASLRQFLYALNN